MAVAVVLTDAQRGTLAVACDTFVPAVHRADDPHGFWARSASDVGVGDEIERRLAEGGEGEQSASLRDLLDELRAAGFDDAESQEDRERFIHLLADSSPRALARVDTLKRLTLMYHYALVDATGANPSWEAIGYPGPVSDPPPVPKPIQPLRPTGDDLTLEADVAIVGSGCGAGVIAAQMTARGKKVVVLEMGGYYNESDFRQQELWAYEHLYLGRGPFPTDDGQVSLQAGSVLGGGGLVNWMNCIRTPDHVRREWAEEHGLEGVDGPDFDRHLDAVTERLQVNDRCSDLNGPQQRLEGACQALGYSFKRAFRNTDPVTYDPATAAFIGFGDQTGSKQSPLNTYLADAHGSGAEFVVHCRIDRVLTEHGRAAGVEGTYRGPDGHEAHVTVRAGQVAVACGSIESPALLLRSGIGGPAAGNYLRLQPATVMFGFYDDPQQWPWGAPQAGVCLEFANLQEGFGYLIETPHATTGTTASRLPWHSAAEHKDLMSRWDHIAPFVCIVRDRGHGRVGIDSAGRPVHEYRLADPLDEQHFRQGIQTLARLHEAAGAREIVPLSRTLRPWRRGEPLEGFLDGLATTPLEPNEYAVLSGHQLGSCRMGADPSTSVAGPWGELHDVKGVWMTDASVFPTAPGCNPMISLMALAHRTSEAMAAA